MVAKNELLVLKKNTDGYTFNVYFLNNGYIP